MRNEHSARRRGRFIVPVSLHNQIRIFTSSNTCFRFTAHAFPHYQLRVFTSSNTHIHFTEYAFPHYCIRGSISPHTCFRSSFCGCIPICGRDKSTPTAANSLPIMLLTDCNNTTFKKQNPYFRNVKPHFCNSKR